MRSELPARLQHLVVVGELAVPVEREANPLGVEPRVVERVDDDDHERQVQERVREERRGPEPDAGAPPGRPKARAPPGGGGAAPLRGERCQASPTASRPTPRRPTHAARAARPSAQIVSTIDSTLPNGQSRVSRNCCLMTLPMRLSSGPPRMSGIAKMPKAGNEHERGARVDARQRERERDAPEALPRAGAEVLRRVEQRLVVLLEVGVQRQHHERQVHVDEADEHRERAEEQRHGLDAEHGEQPVDRARQRGVRPEDDHPRIDANQEVAPERAG